MSTLRKCVDPQSKLEYACTPWEANIVSPGVSVFVSDSDPNSGYFDSTLKCPAGTTQMYANIQSEDKQCFSTSGQIVFACVPNTNTQQQT